MIMGTVVPTFSRLFIGSKKKQQIRPLKMLLFFGFASVFNVTDTDEES